MRSVLVITAGVIAAISLIVGIATFSNANQEQISLTSRLQSRTEVLADSLVDTITPSYRSYATSSVAAIIDKMVSEQRIAALGVYDSQGNAVATSTGLPSQAVLQPLLAQAMGSNESADTFVPVAGNNSFVYIDLLHGSDDSTVIGALAVVEDASYIDNSVASVWWNSMLPLFLQLLIFGGAVFLLVRFVFFKSVVRLAESIQAARRGERMQWEHPGLFKPLSAELHKMDSSLKKARMAASEEARLRLEKLDTPWTEERLKEFTKELLKDRTLVSVSHLEPYVHTKKGSDSIYHVPASGLVTAIEPVMQACGGLWIANGIGDADKLVVDAQSRIAVPPEEPKYTLKRVWLTPEEERDYSRGFCDEAMYPLCLMVHTRPVFREEDWRAYQRVNERFAKTVLEEIKGMERPVIFIQDFQFTLISRVIKAARPDAVIGIFWHIPWVSAEAFSICPWKKEILDGMLGADLIGFHTQLYCNNFIETVGRELEARIDYESSTITRDGHTSLIKPFPVSVAFPNEPAPGAHHVYAAEAKKLLESLGVKTQYVGIGADRLDNTKGLHERLCGIEIFFDTYPEYQGKFTFIQISSTEERTPLFESVEREVERINARFKTKQWKPIVFIPRRHTHEELYRYYRLADVCLVTPLHDGMNLVAKEYVASRSDERGALILSQFAGAAKELTDALIINPYNGKETAEAIHKALTMSAAEQQHRMKKMRSVIKNYTIYRWSAEFIKGLVQLDSGVESVQRKKAHPHTQPSPYMSEIK